VRPFSRRTLLPVAGQATEILAGQATYALEIESGYQAGTRLALDNLRIEGEPSIALDNGALVPLGGAGRAWILWPAGALATPLVLTLWHLPEVTYARDLGGAATAALQEVSVEATWQLLAHAVDVSVPTGTNIWLPSSTTFYEVNTGLTAGGAAAKFPRSRLILWVSQAGGVTATGDAVIWGDHGTGLAAAAFAHIHGSRMGGVASLPVGEGFIIIEIPCPYGRFNVEITSAGGGAPLMSYALFVRKEHL